MAEQILYYFINELGKQGVTTLEQLQQFQFKRWKDLLCNQKENVYE
jgi:hypothetical protein